MKSEQMINSAALFFWSKTGEPIPKNWLDRARDVFAQYTLSPIFFTASGGSFTFDDCYVLADSGADITQFGELILARGSELNIALRAGEIEYLGLDALQPGANDREHSRVRLTISALGDLYAGIDADLISSPIDVLRQAYKTASGLFQICYGIAYQMALAQYPDCYASGSQISTFSDALHWIRHQDEGGHRIKMPDELWSEELAGQRRHLTGLFRGAYPANILSEAHVRSAALLSHGIGKLTELDNSLWLWELSDAEISEAQRMLESRGVLVSQAAAE
jgi:hypothetical protein